MNSFFYKTRSSKNWILALQPKFHEDWCKNGHATRQTLQNQQKLNLKHVFETSSWILTSNWFFQCISTYWDINFHSKCLPAHCDLHWGLQAVQKQSSTVNWSLWCSVKTVGVVALETTVHRPGHFSTAVMSLLVEMSFLLAPSNAAVL